MTAAAYRLCHVTLDGSFSSRNTHFERERAIAVYDLLEQNTFIPVGHDGGPYRLSLALPGARLALHISTEAGAHVMSHYLSLAPYQRLLKDYILTCESFYDAMPRASSARFEAIDMGRGDSPIGILCSYRLGSPRRDPDRPNGKHYRLGPEPSVFQSQPLLGSLQGRLRVQPLVRPAFRTR
ncbi:UPF0262 family protein [Mesorhizobium captivum]|uniref:UPF0262 family protein n=1 Tax=Mesorhizobium captivum TaxID=3072319 RepID=UPI002A23E1B1|nr:UPF0262 family protein [Mesorhizobium sp. VK3C]MDX8450820.1 UPF0262 family protein [Mesorhizobium sp. VK3C]